MSKHSTSASPASSASSNAPPTPPAGPESTVRAACAHARADSVSPPEDCMIWGSGNPPVRASHQFTNPNTTKVLRARAILSDYPVGSGTYNVQFVGRPARGGDLELPASNVVTVEVH